MDLGWRSPGIRTDRNTQHGGSEFRRAPATLPRCVPTGTSLSDPSAHVPRHFVGKCFQRRTPRGQPQRLPVFAVRQLVPFTTSSRDDGAPTDIEVAELLDEYDFRGTLYASTGPSGRRGLSDGVEVRIEIQQLGRAIESRHHRLKRILFFYLPDIVDVYSAIHAYHWSFSIKARDCVTNWWIVTSLKPHSSIHF